MNVLNVINVTKEYPDFKLDNVSFGVRRGTVMGFIGRNGAGKTTTLKAIMNMIHIEKGSVEVFDLNMAENEKAIKQRIGYASGTTGYYKKRKISKLLDITKKFYDNWDDNVCKKYMQLFSLNENKTPSELSEGMKVKLNLTIALSHKAELLILDEPTSGLDPISRAELLEIFKYLKAQGVSVLFSSHITSDLEQCADDITYIRDGKIVYSGDIKEFIGNKTLEKVMLEHEKEVFRESFDI